MPHPWDTGDHDTDWQGYFVAGTDVLRNRLGITARDELQEAEDDLTEARLLELRDTPDVLGSRTYDLRFLSAIHWFLFQDVYVWAGQLRTVGISREGESFCPPLSVNQPMSYVGGEVTRLDRLRVVADGAIAATAAELYDYVNWAHPFRDGNGRSAREFFTLLLSERGSGLDWSQVDTVTLYSACHSARADSDLTGLTEMFSALIDDDPEYRF